MEILKPRILLLFGELPTLSRQNREVGGGAISTNLLIEYLKNYFDIHILTSDENLKDGPTQIADMTFHKIHLYRIPKGGFLNDFLKQKMYLTRLKSIIDIIRPRLIMADTILTSVAVEIGRMYNIKSVIWIRAFETFFSWKESFFEKSGLRKIDFLFKRLLFKSSTANAIGHASLILTNSTYMKNRVSREFGVDSKVIYPPIDMRNYSGIKQSVENNIAFIKPEIKKGLNIVIEIAKGIPHLKFICFGTPPSNYKDIENDLGNIRFAGWINDQKEIFSSMRILLVPSVWAEPFGRVAVEALAAGVLPLVSNVGSLPETVPNASLILSGKNGVKEWINAINYFLSNEGAFLRAIEEGRKHIAKYSIDNQGRRLKEYLLQISS